MQNSLGRMWFVSSSSPLKRILKRSPLWCHNGPRHLVCDCGEPRRWLHVVKAGLSVFVWEMAAPLVRGCNCANCAASSIWGDGGGLLCWKPLQSVSSKSMNRFKNEILIIKISPAIHRGTFSLQEEWVTGMPCQQGAVWEALSLKLPLKEQSRNLPDQKVSKLSCASCSPLCARRDISGFTVNSVAVWP